MAAGSPSSRLETDGESVVDLVDDRHPGRDLQLGDVGIRYAVEVLDQGAEAVAVGRHHHRSAGDEVGADGVVPEGQYAHHHVGQALGGGRQLAAAGSGSAGRARTSNSWFAGIGGGGVA